MRCVWTWAVRFLDFWKHMKSAVAERTDRFVSPLLSVIVSTAAFLRWCVCKIEQTSRLAWSRGYLQCFWRPLNYFPKWHRNRKKRVTCSAALLSGDDKMCKFICAIRCWWEWDGQRWPIFGFRSSVALLTPFRTISLFESFLFLPAFAEF